MPVDYSLLKSDWEFIKDAGAGDLYAGLLEVSARLNTYFNRLPARDQKTDLFLNTYNRVTGQNAAAPEPLQSPDEKTVQESDLEAGNLFVRWKDGDEGSVQAGKQLFDAFADVFRPSICSRQGVLGLLYKGMVNTAELPVLIATHILDTHLSDQRRWYLFALLIGSVINREGVEQFCGGAAKGI